MKCHIQMQWWNEGDQSKALMTMNRVENRIEPVCFDSFDWIKHSLMGSFFMGKGIPLKQGQSIIMNYT